VSGLRLRDLGHVSRPRNLLLFSLMARMNLVEHIGSGVKRIREALKGYGMKLPLIQAEGDWFSITFMRKGPHDAVETLRDKGKVFIPPNGGLVEAVNEGMDEGISEGIKSLVASFMRCQGFVLPSYPKR
jgi:hypothetical protein